MKTLYIDTHYNDIIIGLLNDGKLVKKEEVLGKKNNSEFIFPTIVKVIDCEKIDEVIVVNGPGSFTGVRLGVTIAKTLAYTMNISLKLIDSLMIVHVSTGANKVALSDGNGYYIGEFDDNHNILKDYYYLSNKDFNDNSEYAVEFIYDIEKVYKYLLTQDGINPHGAKPIYVKKIGVEIDKKS